jgi:hypothetical protein
MIKTAVAKLLTVKVASLVIASTAVGGVALAASSGALPNPLAAADADNGSAHAKARPSASHDSAANPSPSMVGLCRAYAAGVAENPGKALENPAFGALISAAGGKDQVSSFCAKVLASAPGNAPSANPGKHPTGKPSTVGGRPSTGPTGTPPAANPTAPPS